MTAANPQTAEGVTALDASDSVSAQAIAKTKPTVAAGAAVKAKSPAQLAALRAASKAFAGTVVPGKPIGRIVIPKIGLDLVMVEGATTNILRKAPGHWPETLFPGQKTNFVVSGHRTSYGSPFRKLNLLEAGDRIDLVMPYARARYTVTRVIIVQGDLTDYELTGK